jgi:hypothetical protein
MSFIFTPTKLKRKIIFVALRINKKITFYCDKLSIETKKSQLHTLPHSTHFRYYTLIENIYFSYKIIYKLGAHPKENFMGGRWKKVAPTQRGATFFSSTSLGKWEVPILNLKLFKLIKDLYCWIRVFHLFCLIHGP